MLGEVDDLLGKSFEFLTDRAAVCDNWSHKNPQSIARMEVAMYVWETLCVQMVNQKQFRFGYQ